MKPEKNDCKSWEQSFIGCFWQNLFINQCSLGFTNRNRYAKENFKTQTFSTRSCFLYIDSLNLDTKAKTKTLFIIATQLTVNWFPDSQLIPNYNMDSTD